MYDDAQYVISKIFDDCCKERHSEAECRMRAAKYQLRGVIRLELERLELFAHAGDKAAERKAVANIRHYLNAYGTVCL